MHTYIHIHTYISSHMPAPTWHNGSYHYSYSIQILKINYC